MEELESVIVLDNDSTKAIVTAAATNMKALQQVKFANNRLVNVIITAGAKGILRFYIIQMNAKDVSSFNCTLLFNLSLSKLHNHDSSASSNGTIPEEIASLMGVSSLTYLPEAKDILAITNDFNICKYTM